MKPYALQTFLSDKKLNFQKFLNLEPLPKDVKNLTDETLVLKRLKSELRDAERSEEIDDIKSELGDISYYVAELDCIINQYAEAYDSITNLVFDIFNNGDIDWRDYSNIEESDWKKLTREEFIKKLLNSNNNKPSK